MCKARAGGLGTEGEGTERGPGEEVMVMEPRTCLWARGDGGLGDGSPAEARVHPGARAVRWQRGWNRRAGSRWDGDLELEPGRLLAARGHPSPFSQRRERGG